MHPTALPHCCLLALLALLTMATPGAQARVWPFSGYEWAVRPPGQGEGPGPNDWNDDAANVQTLPSTGWLQIALVRNATAGTYSCSEVYALQPLGYGAYSWIVRGAVDALGGGDPHVVLGLFLYRDDSHEIDLELSRWGNASVGANNGDFVVQPPTPNSALYWRMPTGVTRAQFTIDFEPTIVRWNVTALLPEVKPVLQWQVTNSTRSPIPPADDMIVHMNIWLFRGQTTNLTLPAVPVVFESFTFTPSSQGGL